MTKEHWPDVPPAQLAAITEAARRLAEIQQSHVLDTALRALPSAETMGQAYADMMGGLDAFERMWRGVDFTALLEAMRPQLDFVSAFQLPQIDIGSMIPPPAWLDVTASASMNNILDQFAETHRRILESFQPPFDFASLTSIMSLRPLVLPAIEEILAADPSALEDLYRARVAREDIAGTDSPVGATPGPDDEAKRGLAPSVQQIWMLAWLMVLTIYMLALAGGGFSREELREDVRTFAVTMMGALVFFGLFPRSKN